MSTVNAQIVDAARQSNDIVIGQGAQLSLAVTYMAAANSIGLIMTNAALTQQGTQQIAQASTAVTCALIVAKGSA
jgi:killing trait domain-containing protein